MATTRAEAVAEVLWELKRADKVACYSEVAIRAGFSAGANGRAMLTCLRAIRKDWPHLHWWRTMKDDHTVEEGEHAERMEEWGATLDGKSNDGRVKVQVETEKVMVWTVEEVTAEK